MSDLESLRDTLRVDGGVLLALQTIQESFGFVPDGAVDLVADVLNVSRAEVHGVLTYYSDLRTSKPARTIVKVCVAESCQAVGARQVVADLKTKGYDVHTGSERDGIAFEQVYCLGNCVLGPSAMVDGKLRGRVSAEALVQEAWVSSR